MPEYKILVKVGIDEVNSKLQDQLNTIGGKAKYKLPIAVELDPESTQKELEKLKKQVQQVEQSVSKAGGGAVKVNVDTKEGVASLNALQRKIDEIKSSKKIPAVDYSIVTTKDGIQQATLTYMDEYKRKQVEVYAWKTRINEENEEESYWEQVKTTYSDKEIARLKMINALREQANAFLSKTSVMSQTEDVTKGTAISNEMLQLLSGDIIPDEAIAKAQQLSGGLKEVDQAVRAVGKNALSWGQSINTAITRTIQWTIATTALFASLHALQNGIQYIIDLNKAMTSIAIVTGSSQEEIKQLSREYNDLAKEIGATTLEVAEGSLEWVRQGKNAEETAMLLKNSMMMSKLAALDSAQATEYMTSIMNGFNLSAEDMASVLDKLVALDNSYATSVGEIAEAMQRSSNSARQAGVSLTELASYITVVSATTRKSAESIGESFKTIFARFTDISTGSLDEEGMGINAVEDALSRVNVTLRDTPTSFRDLSDVLDDLSKKWGTLNEVEQNNIAKAIAGKLMPEHTAMYGNFNSRRWLYR